MTHKALLQQAWDALKDRCGTNAAEQTLIAALQAAIDAPEPTVPDQMQDWAGMDGAIAFHLIERHADNWADIDKMMGEWLEANQPAVRKPLHQVLTDPENQPNQYGVEFAMRGPKMAFSIGNQSFTLNYEPNEPGEFEFMRDMLIKAFSIFTSGVKMALREPLSEAEIDAAWRSVDYQVPYDQFRMDIGRAIEAAVRAKL